jgi:hypothetical protein
MDSRRHCQTVRPFRKLAFGKANMRHPLLENRQQAGKEIEMTIAKQLARLVPPI